MVSRALRGWVAGVLVLVAILGSGVGSGAAQGRVPGVLPAVDTPMGALVHHSCWNCGSAVAVTEDAVWMGTVDAGMVRWDAGGDAPMAITPEEGLPGKAVRAMAGWEDQLWVATLEDSVYSPADTARLGR